MHPIIVLEGPDGSGKTTLGNHLVEQFGAHYMHLTYRFKDRMFHYHWAALELALKHAKHQPVIIDRWWPSEFIYANVYRGGSPWPMAKRMLDRAGLAQGVIYIACIPGNREEHLRQFEERKAAGGEMYETVTEVIDAYDDWYGKVSHRHDVMRYDRFTHGKDMTAFSARIKRRYHDINLRIPGWFQQSRQFAGQFIMPTWMIVGEQSNPKGRHKVWPFFEHANSSLWLTNVLEGFNIPEDEIVWANAFDDEGWAKPQELQKLAKETGVEHIVALGNKASHVLFTAGIKHTRLHHPQYVKRFNSGFEYYEALFSS